MEEEAGATIFQLTADKTSHKFIAGPWIKGRGDTDGCIRYERI